MPNRFFEENKKYEDYNHKR
uniref:Uncharacterized protein n=1 Tax=Romanomermis culicivorax TaxID=13658 RepID=A0A915ITP3_ROMCU